MFTKARLAVFVDGCFWHGCPSHYRPPTSNVAFWRSKREANRNRDKSAVTRLRLNGWSVVRIWEHSLSKPEDILRRIRGALTE